MRPMRFTETADESRAARGRFLEGEWAAVRLEASSRDERPPRLSSFEEKVLFEPCPARGDCSRVERRPPALLPFKEIFFSLFFLSFFIARAPSLRGCRAPASAPRGRLRPSPPARCVPRTPSGTRRPRP